MSDKDWNDYLRQMDQKIILARKGMPEVAKGFSELARAATAPRALDSKTKELIAIAVGIAAHCDACLGYHARAAAKLGATREEILDAIGVAVYMGGGPSMMYGADALDAFDTFADND